MLCWTMKHSCTTRLVKWQPQPGTKTSAASVGKSRTAVLRRREPRRCLLGERRRRSRIQRAIARAAHTYSCERWGIARRRTDPGWRRGASLPSGASNEHRASRSFLCERRRRRRILDVRAACLQEKMAEQGFRSGSFDEDGGNPANIAASGASNQTHRDARAAQH